MVKITMDVGLLFAPKKESHGALSSDRHVPNFNVVCCDGYKSR
jgi:hypothetical protein